MGLSGKARPSKSAGLRVPAFNDARKLANSLSATVSSWMTSAPEPETACSLYLLHPAARKQGAAHPKTKYSAPFRFNTPSHTHHELSAANSGFGAAEFVMEVATRCGVNAAPQRQIAYRFAGAAAKVGVAQVCTLPALAGNSAIVCYPGVTPSQNTAFAKFSWRA